MHERPIVHLIHKIQISTIGQKLARNELRVKYHYHTCSFRIQSDFFLKIYDLLYSRTLGLNRYTLILGKNENIFLVEFYFLFVSSCWKYHSIDSYNIR